MKFSRKIADFGHFFNSCPVVLSNAAPDRPDTAHPQRAPDAHYTRPTQAGLRRTAQKILNYYWFFGKGWTRFVLPTVMQKPTSWRGPQKRFFLYFKRRPNIILLSGGIKIYFKRRPNTISSSGDVEKLYTRCENTTSSSTW